MALTWMLLFLQFSLVISQGQSLCPEGFERHGNSCYRAVDIKANWIDAKMYCRVLGGDLVIIESQAEETIVEGLLTKLHGASHPLPVEGYWADGTDILAEGEFRWMREDGQSIVITGYTNWSPGQPDNVGVGEHCLHLWYSVSLHWNDYECDKPQRFICEASINGDVGQIIG